MTAGVFDVRIADRRKSRGSYFLRYTDPVDGKQIERSAKTKSKAKALRAAGQWQAELSAGVDTRGKPTSWESFRQGYEDSVVSEMRKSSRSTVLGILNNFERVMSPDRLSRISTAWLRRYMEKRLKEVSPTTIHGDFRVLHAALVWAHQEGWLTKVPDFPKVRRPKSSKVMKGRPVTEEEFDRMLSAVKKVPNVDVESVQFLLKGLWWSGLRLGEAIGLTWDYWAETGIRVDLSGEFAVLHIRDSDEKGGENREYPVAPEFGDFLRAVPEDRRTGHVFNVRLSGRVSRNSNGISRKLVAVGKAAGVKVDQRTRIDRKTKARTGVTVWASAHDLRRAFGLRWSRRLMPFQLKALMRHKTIQTTEKYYVSIEAQDVARRLRAAQLSEQIGEQSRFSAESI